MSAQAIGVAALIAFALTSSAQRIRVDATPSHFTNGFRPTEALGAGIDRLNNGAEATDKLFNKEVVRQVLSAGWQTVTYRQNTELKIEAWHWNPEGTWSDPAEKGYFTGNSTPAKFIRHSYGYSLPHRGTTRDDGTDHGYSRLTDGDADSYWKSNPYLTQPFTGEDDALHPQWVLLDLAAKQKVTSIRIAWGDPYARKYLIQYWTGDDPIRKPAGGIWQRFPGGMVGDGKGGVATLQLCSIPIAVRWVRVVMIESSNTPDPHGPGDRRNSLGYAIRELYLGTTTPDGNFHDLVRHTPDQDQTMTYCSSVDPWHTPADVNETGGDQIGFDLFYTGGFTRNLPAMVPVAMLYGTPDDAVAEIAYLKKRGYPISYIELGEEPDGHYAVPEDYAALYLQWATALHKLDANLKLGGPAFTGQNTDLETWGDTNGHASWTGRFIDYLKAHGRLGDLAFFSYEHYPMEPGKIQWSSLYDEPKLVSRMVGIWRQDGLPAEVPQFITESNLAWKYSEAYADIWGALWLADYVGAYLTAGGKALYFFHYLPAEPGSGTGNYAMFSTDSELHLKQPLSQYFASQLINLEWVQPGNGLHRLFRASSDVRDGAGHSLITAYAVLRPDGQWALMAVNKDQENAHPVRITFADADQGTTELFAGPVKVTTFGSVQYQWHPTPEDGSADPDGPPARSTLAASADGTFVLPRASVTVLCGSKK